MAFPHLRTFFVVAAFGAALSSGMALGAESDTPLRFERLGQGLQSLGKRLDVTQLFDRPPRELDEEPAPSPRDAAAASVRIDRLESQIRSLNGMVEQLQHQVRRLEEQLRRPQEGAAAPPPRVAGVGSEPSGPLAPPAPGGLRRGDSFDPNRDPSAPGAPRPLGTTSPSAPLPAGTAAVNSELRSPGAPLDLTHGLASQTPPAPAEPTQSAVLAPGAAATLPQTPRDEFDVALAHLRLGEYEAAEKGFSGFLGKNGKSKLAPQATYYLGESFFLRERHREAAEKFLEISTKYPTSPQAPEAMLRLGQSLHAIGAKEQACASFSEIAVKYPGASTRVKEAAQRESRKDQC